MEGIRISTDSDEHISDDHGKTCGLGATFDAVIRCRVQSLLTAVPLNGAVGIKPAAANATSQYIHFEAWDSHLNYIIWSHEPLPQLQLYQRLQQDQQGQRGQLQRQATSKWHMWQASLLLLIVFVSVMKSSAAASYSAVQDTLARRSLQDRQLPTLPPEPPPPPPPQEQHPQAAPLQLPESLLPDRPQRPIQPSAPPPPDFLAFASTSREFFNLLYLRPNVTEIRLVRDIKLLAEDAIAAMKKRSSVHITPNADANSRNDTDTSTLVSEPAAAVTVSAVGIQGPLLDRNLTVLGFSRGTHTRLDMNFLASILRLEAGVQLKLQKLELCKALNHLGQDMDFIGNSDGGDVILEDCVQRRPACLPFSMAAIHIQSLPNATGPELQNQLRDVVLRNDSAFCWSTSTLVPNCKQPSIDVNSIAVHAASDSVFPDSGGYDVSYMNSHIVCDYPVDPACLQTTAADRCLARELVRRFGEDVVQSSPPFGGSPAAATAALVLTSAAAAPRLQPVADGHDGGHPTRDRTAALSAGIASGVGGLALLLSILGVMVLRQSRRRRRRQQEEGEEGEGDAAARGGKGRRDTGNAARSHHLLPLPPPPTGGCGGWEGLDVAADQAAAVVQQQEGVGPTALRAGLAAAAAAAGVTLKDTIDGGGGGGGAAVNSCSSQEVNSSSCDDDHRGIETIRGSLLRAALRNPEVPLQVQILALLGEGSFGKVYKGVWQGTLVAVKALALAGNLTQSQRRHQMAIMKAAISSSMSHPNIVQTYTYSFQPIYDVTASDSTGMTSSGSAAAAAAAAAEGSGGGGGDPQHMGRDASATLPRVFGYELHLLIEYCNRGSLRQALDAGLFHRKSSGAAASGVGGDGLNGRGGCGGPLAEDRGNETSLAGVVMVVRGEAAETGQRTDHHEGDSAPANVEAGGGLLIPAAELSTLAVSPPSLPPPPFTRTGCPDHLIGEVAVAVTVAESRRGASLDHGTCCFVKQQQQQQQQAEPQLSYNYGLMLQVACDVASALLHLHNHGVVHGDVKASNVLLKTAVQDERRFLMPEATAIMLNVSGGGSASGATFASPASLSWPPSVTTASSPSSPKSTGLIAKIADFGLSIILGMEGDEERTHVTALTAQGSLTHMAPEIMLQGRISKGVDVYALGILLYELFTADRAHRGLPRALLPHQVAVCGLRPSLPYHTPPDYRRLVEACWAADPANRPTLEVILAELERMRAAHGAATIAAAFAASCGASFSYSASRGSISAFSYGNTVRRDGWVLVPSIESSTCSSTLFPELVGTREGEELEGCPRSVAAGGGGAGVMT